MRKKTNHIEYSDEGKITKQLSPYLVTSYKGQNLSSKSP